ncbi:PAS domain S-box-containing protein [Sphingobium sp. B11D3A]|nr:PAS domain S-box-containing protein [Sphingobium sp. B11D3A]
MRTAFDIAAGMAISDIIDASSTAAVISNPRLPDNPIIACNEAFLRLTGYSRAEILGRNCRFLHGAETEAASSELLRTAIRQKKPAIVEITNYRKDGSPFRNAVMIAPMFDSDGGLEYFLGSQVEVAAVASAEPDSRKGMATARVSALTERQRRILVLMSAGKLNKQIAFDLGLSERTVKMHRAALFQALGVRTGADAIRLAVEAGY